MTERPGASFAEDATPDAVTSQHVAAARGQVDQIARRLVVDLNRLVIYLEDHEYDLRAYLELRQYVEVLRGMLLNLGMAGRDYLEATVLHEATQCAQPPFGHDDLAPNSPRRVKLIAKLDRLMLHHDV